MRKSTPFYSHSVSHFAQPVAYRREVGALLRLLGPAVLHAQADVIRAAHLALGQHLSKQKKEYSEEKNHANERRLLSEQFGKVPGTIMRRTVQPSGWSETTERLSCAFDR